MNGRNRDVDIIGTQVAWQHGMYVSDRHGAAK